MIRNALHQTTIRRALSSDAAEIAHVHVAGWRTAYRDLLPADYLAGLSAQGRQDRWCEILNSSADHEFSFVALVEGKIVGFINGGPERTDDSQFAGEIYSLYLLEQYRRQGIGAALFRGSVAFLLEHNINSLKVWVLRENPYRSFYERQGGRPSEEKTIVLGGVELVELAYGWTSLTAF